VSPNRIIRDSCCRSETLDRISAEAERLWWRLIATADDFGRFEADPVLILAACFPRKSGIWKTNKIDSWLNELRRVDAIRLYQSNGKTYGFFPTWDQYQQRRASHSKFPDPASSCVQMIADASSCKQMSPRHDIRDTNTRSELTQGSVAPRRDAIVSHYLRSFGRRSYQLTPERTSILDEALRSYPDEILTQAIDIYATHERFAFQRTNQYDGLCEYVLAKGKKVSVRARIEEILRAGGFDIAEETDSDSTAGSSAASSD
jgi:hypothetical protein